MPRPSSAGTEEWSAGGVGGAEFLYEIEETRVMARCRALISVREPQLLTINMFDDPTLARTAQEAFETFQRSVYYV